MLPRHLASLLLAPPLRALLIVASALASSPTGAADPPVPCAGIDHGPARSVTHIIDGETVALDDGTELRLVGALAARAIDADAEPGTWPPEAAAVQALRALVLGKSVELRFAGERTDRYGRIRAQAFLIETSEKRWVQGHLVEHGFARAYGAAGSRACTEELLAAESRAREARRGLWAEAAYQVRQAERPSELLRYRATFQVVQDRVVHVAQVRGTIYLNFQHNWWRGFSASLRRGDRDLLGAYASNPRGLEGRSVRVRGWIERRRGRASIIDLSAAGAIEVMSEAERPLRSAP